jgi:hypothetical protein
MTLCSITQSLLQVNQGGHCEKQNTSLPYEKLKSLGVTSPQRNIDADILRDWPKSVSKCKNDLADQT